MSSRLNNWKEKNVRHADEEYDYGLIDSNGNPARYNHSYSPVIRPTTEQRIAKAQTAVVDELVAILKREIEAKAHPTSSVAYGLKNISRFLRAMSNYELALRSIK